MADESGEDRIMVRLKPDDTEALDWLVAYVRQQCGPGVRVERSDAVRWALHTCKRGLQVDTQDEEGR